MPLRECLNERIYGDAERPVYWLSATDAAALNRVVGDIESAFLALDEAARNENLGRDRGGAPSKGQR